MDYKELLERVKTQAAPAIGRGEVASYIPALARVRPDRFGIALATVDGDSATSGDADVPFSVQSISKVFTLILAIRQVGDALWTRVGREPSGSAFNSLVQLETEHGIPRNPLINAGALVVADVLLGHTRDAKQVLLDFVRALSGNADARFDPDVVESERNTGFRNAALANFLKAHGNLKHSVDEVLDLYFHQCALSLCCADLARAFLPLANGGFSPLLGESILTKAQAKRVNALMMTCGLYDAAGDFAYRVGLPAKSGVGGGIAAVLPREFAICVWSPALEESGNSSAGVAALEALTTILGRSVF
ncbi:MAG: glutaminase [Alphaproteobacteria bacterium]|nr:glutaminase [Alphaproteobacteria bacterium]